MNRTAEEIVARARTARAVLVLDETVAVLAPALRAANLLVVLMPSGATDARVRESYLAHRILVTRKPADFVDDAPIHEYGIVSLEKVDLIDRAPKYEENRTARLISKALTQFRLCSPGARFLLRLSLDGDHVRAVKNSCGRLSGG